MNRKLHWAARSPTSRKQSPNKTTKPSVRPDLTTPTVRNHRTTQETVPFPTVAYVQAAVVIILTRQ